MNALALDQDARARDGAWLGVCGVAALALAARPNTMLANAVLPLIGLVGLLVPVRRERARALTWLAVVAAGVAIFAAGKALGPVYHERADATWIVLLVVAGVTEEALFRRGMYGAVAARGGEVLAVVVTALVFALIHVPIYGWEVLAIDAGAGLVLGWQRWASRSWTAPAVTHSIANLMQAGWL